MKAPDTIYRGAAATAQVSVDGRPLDSRPSQLLCNHSPDGFMWGYGGNGPGQLALAILLDYYGSRELALAWHQDFKRAVIAALPMDKDWVLTGGQIQTAMDKVRRADEVEQLRRDEARAWL